MKLKIVILIPLLPIIVFQSCIGNKLEKTKKEFVVSKKVIQNDKMIVSASYFKNNIFCLQQDHKLLVIDSTLKKDSFLTNKLSRFNVEYLVSSNDTVYVSINEVLYFIDSTFSLKKYDKPKSFRYALPDLIDSTFYVYSCRGGEWRGSVFFLDRKSDKIYSYPSMSVQQVVLFKNHYVVCNSLAHGSGFSNYLIIEDPTKLYELKDDRYRTECNWYRLIDSMKNKKDEEYNTSLPAGVLYSEHPDGTLLLSTFVHENSLYSIVVNDSFTILCNVINSKPIQTEVLLPHRIKFTSTNTNLCSSKLVTAYRMSWAMTDKNGKTIEYNNSGLVYIYENQINFIEFEIPPNPLP